MSNSQVTRARQLLNQARTLREQVREDIRTSNFVSDDLNTQTYNDLIVTASQLFSSDPVLSGLAKMPDQIYGLNFLLTYPQVLSARIETHITRLINRLEILLGEELVEEKYPDEIIPLELYKGTRQNIKSIADQINKSFHFGIYDGCAVLMRRLIEMLLILAFKEINQEDSIRGADKNYKQLSQIIKEAEQNKALDLSRNAKTYLGLFKEKGDLSAHNPLHLTFRRDIEHLQPKFRHLVQELLYKAGILK